MKTKKLFKHINKKKNHRFSLRLKLLIKDEKQAVSN